MSRASLFSLAGFQVTFNGRFWVTTEAPKRAVSSVVEFIKGKSAISIARNFMGRKRNFTGESFWARGYFVSTVGLEEEVVREYIRRQEQEEQRLEQLNMPWERKPPSGGS